MVFSAAVTVLVYRARFIARTLGYRSAAGFLRNRGVEFDHAYRMIFNRRPAQ